MGRRQEGVLGDQGVGLHGAGGLRRQTMGVERSIVTPKIYYEHAYYLRFFEISKKLKASPEKNSGKFAKKPLTPKVRTKIFRNEE